MWLFRCFPESVSRYELIPLRYLLCTEISQSVEFSHSDNL